MEFRFNRKFAFSCAAVLAAGALLWWWTTPDTPTAAPTVADKAHQWDGPIGPGLMSSHARASASADEPDLDEVPKDVVRVDARGNLITDVQLHNAMDSYLLHADVPSRQIAANQLRAYLKRKLSGQAAADADTLVTHYLAYMDAHDEALGRVSFAPLGAEGFSDTAAAQAAAWLQQRRSLRQSMLGSTIYKEWFAAEDTRCADLFAALAGASAAPRDPMQASDARDCAVDMEKSFASTEKEERQWTRHFAAYRDAAQRIAEQDPARRAQMLATLRQQIFSNDAERQRAKESRVE